MKVALIGAGKNGMGHVKRLAAMDDVTVVAIADTAIEPAEASAASVGAKAYGDHRAMLEEARPDAVWVSSPNWLHAEHTVDCANAGCHVMCEKPMALNLEDCDRMIEAARASNVQLTIGQSLRYFPGIVEARRILESGRIGDLVSPWSIRMSQFGRADDTWRLAGDKSGGCVMELHVHEIDFVRIVGGEVTQVYAKTAHTWPHAPTFLNHFTAVLGFKNGAFANLEGSWAYPLGMATRGIIGSRGAIEIKGKDAVSVMTTDMDKAEVVKAAGSDRTLDDDFVQSLRDGSPPPVTPEDGRANIEIALAIVKSGETGEAVNLPLL